MENNRDIFNRVDDSVVRGICGKEQIFGRSRGYVPEPLVDIYNVEWGIAFGAHITSAFAIGRSKQILLSQYIGELEDLDAQKSFNECLSNFKDMFLFKPTFVVCDMHPNYYSTEVANNYASDNNLPIYKVQHHHAHIVSVMAEYGLEGKVLGVALDGTGLGSDGMSWGGEVFLCDRGEFERLDHLPYVPLLGGDKAAKECWRMAVSFIESVYKEDSLNILSSLGLMSRVEEEKIVGVLSLINSPLQKNFTSSVGRLFDNQI